MVCSVTEVVYAPQEGILIFSFILNVCKVFGFVSLSVAEINIFKPMR